jgi:hypothetical protein
MLHANARRMSTEAELLKARTMRFALDVLPGDSRFAGVGTRTDGETPVGASGNGSCLQLPCCVPKPIAHRIHRQIGVVCEEADESQGWLDFVIAAQLLNSTELTGLVAEATEIVSVMSSSYGTAREHERTRQRKNKRIDRASNRARWVTE